jgi:hypothetical protein
MPTARQIEAERRRARAELERDRRKRDREKLRVLRAHLRQAKKLKRARMREVVQACAAARRRLRQRRKELRARYLAELATLQERNRLASRTRCDAAKERARARQSDSVRRATAALQAERAHQEQLAVWANPNPLQQRETRRRTAEYIAESDSVVANNLPADLLPVWRAVKSRIKGGARRSRTEAFLEWVQEHRGEVQRIVSRQIDDDVAELVAHEAELRKHVMQPAHYRRMSSRELASDVPF